ncbi:hypothetical protein F8568_006510 [Actinomadura sp. LD22]|uniref:Uncharacterized protein n=1 Tax=Actinomadura physcomitrii TaxID=2650748 RepID=A0A6I4M3M1_9ACTN|nr:hypothetical protein [Actinomadura physcomitrii]MWA00032.1 hypothetical protein [Actinomadura physcomitrii]
MKRSMRGKLPDVSTTQLIASGVATLVAAVGASYLGVYGTIIGAALMSVVSTAGSAVVKHYLDQGRDQIKDLTHLQAAVLRQGAAEQAAAQARSADPTRTVVWPAGDPNATRLDLNLPGHPSGGGDPNATRLDRTPAETVADALAAAASPDAVREVVRRSALDATADRLKQHWVKLAVSSAAIFAIVIGGITLYEAATGSPLGDPGNGTTISKALTGGGGGGSDETPTSPSPTGHSTGPGATPSTGPSGGTPSSGTPTTTAPAAPTREPTEPTAPTSSAPSTPETPSTPQPTKTSDGGDGRQPGGGGAEPNVGATPNQ